MAAALSGRSKQHEAEARLDGECGVGELCDCLSLAWGEVLLPCACVEDVVESGEEVSGVGERPGTHVLVPPLGDCSPVPEAGSRIHVCDGRWKPAGAALALGEEPDALDATADASCDRAQADEVVGLDPEVPATS